MKKVIEFLRKHVDKMAELYHLIRFILPKEWLEKLQNHLREIEEEFEELVEELKDATSELKAARKALEEKEAELQAANLALKEANDNAILAAKAATEEQPV